MKLKAMRLLVLLGIFYFCGGFRLPHGAFDTPILSKHNPTISWIIIMALFISGACTTLWGEQDRRNDPPSLIPCCIYRPGSSFNDPCTDLYFMRAIQRKP